MTTQTCATCGAEHDLDEQAPEDIVSPTPIIWECHAPVEDGPPAPDSDGELVQGYRACRGRNVHSAWTGPSATTDTTVAEGVSPVADSETVAVATEGAPR